MPELPEVETIKRDLEKSILNQTIEGVDIYDKRVIRGLSEVKFRRNLTGLQIKNIQRRGKAIIFSFSPGGHLVVQVKMTGFFVYGEHLKEK